MIDDTHTLALLLDELIPASVDGRLPGAGTLGVGADVEAAVRATPALGPVIASGLSTLEAIARKHEAGGFAALSPADRIAVLRELEAADAAFVPTVMMLAYVAYYGNDRVLVALKTEARAPHPRGYEVEADDPALLDPVRARGKLYRDC
jgi:hypothetical protein